MALHHHASSADAQTLQGEIQAAGGQAELFRADLTDPAAPAKLARDVEAKLGPLSILVNSAGRFDQAPFVQTSLQVLDATWNLNARAPFS